MAKLLIQFITLLGVIAIVTIFDVHALNQTNYVLRSNYEIELSPANKTISKKHINFEAQNEARFEDTTGGEYVGLKAPGTVSASLTFTLPGVDGSAGNCIKTDGLGVLSFAACAANFAPTVTDQQVVFGIAPGSGSGSANLLYDYTNNELELKGSLFLSGNASGSGTGTFGQLVSQGNVVGSGTGDFGAVKASGEVYGSGSGEFRGGVKILTQNPLELQDAAGGEYVRLRSHATVSAIYTLTLPSAQGSSGQVMQNDGSGNLSWQTITAAPSYSIYSTAVDYTILDGDGYSIINVTDSDPQKTITLPTAADNTNRCITVINNSTEQATTANVLVDAEGAETIGAYSSVSLRFRGRQTTVCSTGSAWLEKDTNRKEPVSVRIEQTGTHSVLSCSTSPCWVSSTVTDLGTGRSSVDIFGNFSSAPHCRCENGIVSGAVCVRGTSATNSFSLFAYNTSFAQTDSDDILITCNETD